jgi:hypothetical protein
MQSLGLGNLQSWLSPYAELLVSAAPYAGVQKVRVTSVRRSKARQQALYRRFLAGQSRFPAAPPGRSLHEHGLAWDMVTEPYSALPTLGHWWQQLGGFWTPKDPIHFAAVRSVSDVPPYLLT